MSVRLTEEGIVESKQTYSINNLALSLNIAIDTKIENKTRRWETKKLVVNVVLMNMLACHYRKARLHYSRDKNARVKSMYNSRGINGYDLMKAIDFLEDMGYLVNHIAKRQYGKVEDKMSSWIEPTPFFMSEFISDEELLMKANNAFNAAWMPIIMRDDNKEPVDYRADENTFAMSAVLNRLNEVNSKFVFTDHDGLKFQNLYCRIFNNSNFMEGGRFYKASVLNIPNRATSNRLKIKIDGEDVVEVDYTALHIFMTAEKLGCAHEYGDDPYKRVAGIPRNVVKLAVNIMFNCTSRGQAIRSIKDRVAKLGYVEQSATEIVTAIYHAFPQLTNEFCYKQCSGLRLQNQDSWMTHYVANVMSTLSRPYLPIHDSGIVRAQDEELLIELMCEAYREILDAKGIVHMKSSKMVDGEVVKTDVSC